MKLTKLIFLLVLTGMLSSCGAPIVQRSLGAPARLINSVVGPIVGPLMPN